MKVFINKSFEFSELEREKVEKYYKKMVKKGYIYAEIRITTGDDEFPRYLATLTKSKEVEL